ncbi:MAG: hypothetical protein IKX59_02555 [Bacteroidales bacterium]|nr:hypothetical protein [Bacteroidales bacterium]
MCSTIIRNKFRHFYVAIALLTLLNATALQAHPDSVFVDGADSEEEYEYNDNGALTKDLNRGITGISYDDLGNPRKISFTVSRSIEYVYSADGTKLRTIHKKPKLKNSHPEMLQFDGGYASFSHDTIDGLHYYIQDYQGNTLQL